MSLIYANMSLIEMKKITCNIVILSSKMTVFYIYNINYMKIYLKITLNVIILGSKITYFKKIYDIKIKIFYNKI